MSGFKTGDLILKSKPYACVLSNAERGKRCDFCFTRKSVLERCSQCKFAYFCNKNCQTKAWDDHKEECKHLRKVYPQEPTLSLRLLVQIIFKTKKLGFHDPFENIVNYKRTFHDLESHSANIKDDLTAVERIISFLGALNDYIGPENLPSVPDFIEIYGKMVINTFSILDEELNSIGSGLYLGASIFDHSCVPDAEVVFIGTTLVVRAVRDIPHRDVKNIYISYIDTLMLPEKRLEELQQHYYFSCQCRRCTTNVDDLMKKVEIDAESAKHFEEHSSKEIQRIAQMRKKKDSPSIIYEAAIEELASIEGILGDTHINRVKLVDYLFDATIQLGNWNEALFMGLELVRPFKLFYGEYHPNCALLLLKVSKIQILLNKLEGAEENLIKAEKVIRISHGTDHPLYLEYGSQMENYHRARVEAHMENLQIT